MTEKKNVREENTEDRILDAAFDVVYEKTISGTRMALIAERADMFQSNIHYYFKSKHELMMAVQKKVFDRCAELQQALLSSCGSGMAERIGVFWGQKRQFIVHEQRYDFAEIDFWVQARVDDAIKAAFVESFRVWRGKIADMLREFGVSNERAAMLAAVMTSMMEGASFQYLIDPAAFDIDGYFDYCTQMVIREIRNG